jgi:hypothetical protein
MNIFKKQFEELLVEIDGIDDLPSPAGDDAAMSAGLDGTAPAGDFNDVPRNPTGDVVAAETSHVTEKLASWIGKIEDFIEYLNGLDPNSMNYELNRADCSSIMSDVQRSESKKISRVAQDLSSLGESLKQYLLGAERKARESQANAQPPSNF